MNLQNMLSERSEIAQPCLTLCNPMDSSLHQAPPSMGFSRQKYWSGLPFPSSGKEASHKKLRYDSIYMSVQIKQIYRDRKYMCYCLGLRVGQGEDGK